MRNMRKYVLILALLVLVTGFASAQSNSNTSDNSISPGLTPASPFYGIELFVENLEVKIAGAIGGSDMKSKALANNAEERVSEAQYLVENNRSDKAAEAIEKYSQTLNQSIELAAKGQDENLKQKINNISSKNVETLKQVKEKVPEQARPAIENAINRSEKRRGPPEQALNNTDPPGKNPDRPEVSSKAEESLNKTARSSEADIPDGMPEETSEKISQGLERNTSEKTRDPSNSTENATGSVGNSVDSSLSSGEESRNNKITENSSLTSPR